MCVVRDFERSILKRKSVKDEVHQEGFRHFYLKFLQLSHNVPHLHDMFTHTSYSGELQECELHN